MNPCAPTFVPTVEDGSSNEDDPLPLSTKTRRSTQNVRPKPRQSVELPSITIDPNQYDTMFPALQGVQVDVRSVRSPKQVKKRQNKRFQTRKLIRGQIQRSSPDDEEETTIEHEKLECEKDESDNNNVGDESVNSSSEEVEYLKPTVYTPKKSLEYLKPTVYTPPTSSRESHIARSGVVKRSVRSANSRSSTRSPRRAWRPPTPHPEGKPRGPKSRRSPAPGDVPTRYLPTSPVPPLSYGHCYPEYPGSVQQHIDYAPFMLPPMQSPIMPSMMPFAAWHMPPAPWPMPLAQPSNVGCPLDCECHFERVFGHPPSGDSGALYGPPPPQAYVHPQLQSRPQMQQQSPTVTEYDAHSQPTSRSSAEKDDRNRPSHIRSVKNRHGQKPSMSSSVLTTNGPTAATPLKTQVERIKQESRDRQLLGVVCKDDTKREQIGKDLREAAEYTKTTGFIPTRQVKSAQYSPGVLRAAKINIKRESQTHAQEKSRGADQKPSNPLQNAPTGPASTRTLTQSFSATVKKALNLNGFESGGWSQSKSWTSFATKERQAFQKMMTNLRYMSADQSPFVPQSPAELTAFKATLAESKTKKLGQEVQQRLAETNAKDVEGAEDKNNPTMKLLGGKKFEDQLSPVFAAVNCFNKARMMPPNGAEWPSIAELKEEGDKRANREGRCLPLPRMGLVAHRFLHWDDEAYDSDGSIHWDKKIVQVRLGSLCPVTGHEPSTIPPTELQTDEASFLPADLLHDIDPVDIEKEENEEEKKKKKGGKDLKKEKKAEKKEISK
ncbi:40s ribosomal s8 [Fusarium sporotrichioides]|uniref:40s ribosomal s8 n=1 Tax=Fusarium sporotrichioides TaxID=5514 RepID=A0A395SE47_FUSSP|nr:40s ribosomal s8 [Fusarium sporotrichioides]